MASTAVARAWITMLLSDVQTRESDLDTEVIWKSSEATILGQRRMENLSMTSTWALKASWLREGMLLLPSSWSSWLLSGLLWECWVRREMTSVKSSSIVVSLGLLYTLFYIFNQNANEFNYDL